EDDGLQITSSGLVTAHLVNPEDNDDEVYITGTSPTFQLKDNQVTITSGDSSVQFSNFPVHTGKYQKELYLEATGEITFQLEDINIQEVRYGPYDVEYSIIDEIHLGDNTRLVDLMTGNDITVEKETDYGLSEGYCTDKNNCIEYYFDSTRAGTMTVNVGISEDGENLQRRERFIGEVISTFEETWTISESEQEEAFNELISTYEDTWTEEEITDVYQEAVERFEAGWNGEEVIVELEDYENHIEIKHVMLDIDQGITHLTVNDINDESTFKLTEEESRYIFSSEALQAQGNLALSSVSFIETSASSGLKVGEEVELGDDLFGHKLVVQDGQVRVCSNCKIVGSLVSESSGIDLTPKEQSERNFILMTRMANNPQYGAEYGGSGDYIYPFVVGETNFNKLPSGSQGARSLTYTKGNNERLYDCTSSVCYVVSQSTGVEKYHTSVEMPIEDLCANHGWECTFYSRGPIEKVKIPDIVVRNDYEIKLYDKEEINNGKRGEDIFSDASRGSPAIKYAGESESHAFMIGDTISGVDTTIEFHVGSNQASIDERGTAYIEASSGVLVAHPPKDQSEEIADQINLENDGEIESS
ncbi:MAG: hypothetical protein KJ896_02365, partial [Nanoarchaeota archaeon]|nr:hypothetical protein [Nanoarchaeota archaeon]